MILSNRKLSILAATVFDRVHSSDTYFEEIHVKVLDAICLALDVDEDTEHDIYMKIYNDVKPDMGIPAISKIIAKHIASL